MLPVRRLRAALGRTCACSALFTLAALASGCAQGSTVTAPSAATASTTAATISEIMAGTLPVGGARYYSFSMATAGSVTATLQSIGGADVPETVVVNMGIGTPAGTICSGGQSAVQASGGAGLTSQVTSTQEPGTHCVVVADVGNLFAPATFRIQIDHP